MREIESESQFNKIYVIQSLSDDELSVGERLVRDDIEPTLKRHGLGICHVRVTGRKGFFDFMRKIKNQCAQKNLPIYPILHIDAHGAEDKSGIFLNPSQEIVTWSEFAKACRDINLECHNTLLITAAICYGLLSITKVSILDVTPFFAFVGPQEEVIVKEVEEFSGFYIELLENGDFVSAMEKLSPKFNLYLSERLFLNTYAGHIKSYSKGRGKRERIEKLLSEFRKHKDAHIIGLTEARRLVKDYVRPNQEDFEKYKNQFLLSNHPENIGRFPSTLEDAMTLADS